MTRLPLSPAASALLRALLKRSGLAQNRIILTEARSVDWQSLTFVGERHEIGLLIIGIDSPEVARRLLDGLDEHEFKLTGQIVADIQIGEPVREADGSTALRLEVLTIAE